jgi:hypothetical protein
MTGDELLTFARRDWLRDLATPQLWSDDLIYLYLNEAQQKFCRKTFALYRDDLTVDIIAGTTDYALDTTVLFVFNGALTGEPIDMNYAVWRKLPRNNSSVGTPRIFTFDEQSNVLRVSPTPDAAYTMHIGAAVLPSADIDTTTEPEIDEEYHIDLLEWVAYRCLRNNDVDGQKMDTGELFRKTWDERIRDVKREVFRMRMGFDPHAQRSWTGKRGK